jgi:hypothetical protein
LLLEARRLLGGSGVDTISRDHPHSISFGPDGR